MNENMRDVTSKRPFTLVINVTSSQSCDITTFSTGVSCLELEKLEYFHIKMKRLRERGNESTKMKYIITVVVQHLISFPLPVKLLHLLLVYHSQQLVQLMS